MELPTTNLEPKLEKMEGMNGENFIHCDLFDTELAHKIAATLLPGLGTACIDNTTGDLFKSPASVAADMRKEMVNYLIERSESFVAESAILVTSPNEEVSDHPYDVISKFVDDFAALKMNFFSRVSGWILSESREDKIEDFVQEMEINRFWIIDVRKSVAQTLLKNVDVKNIFHCNMKFNSAEDLKEHNSNCNFRCLNCPNEGCDARISAGQMEMHDILCLFKILLCEQKCCEYIMRREMDKHCITVCPMRLVSCPFYSVGCSCNVPHSLIQQHCVENVRSHLMYILQSIHKEASIDDLEHRVEQLEMLSSLDQLTKARDVRRITSAAKDLEAKLSPLKVSTTNLSELTSKPVTSDVMDLEARLELLEIKAEE